MSQQTVKHNPSPPVTEEHGMEKLSVMTSVSPRTIAEIKKGYVPSQSVQRRMKDGINANTGTNLKIEDLFPDSFAQAA